MSDTDNTADAGTTEQTTPAPAASTQTEKTFTQTEVNQLVKDRLDRQKAQFADYNELKAKAGEYVSLQTQLQTLQGEKASIESDFNLAARDAQMLKVAIDKGVPADMVDRLKGNTQEELEADADTLMSRIGTRNQFSGFNGGTAPGATVQTPENIDDAVRRALLR